jgi:hypothetical protein
LSERRPRGRDERRIDTLVKHFASVLGERSIRVNAVAPGVVATDMSSFAKTDAGRNAALGMQALKRLAQPDDIGGVVAFLASDDARWITGDTIRVDGGSKLWRGLHPSLMGFAAIVMLLRQTLGGHLRAFDALFARVYMEFAVIVSIGAMLPPLLMLWDLPTEAMWRLSGGLVAVPLLWIGVGYPARRRATTGEPTPRYVRVIVTIMVLISLTLGMVATGILHERSGPVFLAALTVFFTAVLITWLRALSMILVPEAD